MECRSQKASGAAIVIAIWLAPAVLAQKELRFEVRHDHWRKDGSGMLVIDERGIAYHEVSKKKHHDKWEYQDIQQLYLSPNRLTVVSYKDRKWRLGLDKEYEFRLPPGKTFKEAYALLKDRLDQRFVAALADADVKPIWEIPVKLLGRIRGSEGLLMVSPDRIVYKTDSQEQSRTWRFQDIENISSSGRFQLTLTTFERAKVHYGNLKGFNFQLKQPLDEKRYNILWRRLNRTKGSQLLTSIQERETEQ